MGCIEDLKNFIVTRQETYVENYQTKDAGITYRKTAQCAFKVIQSVDSPFEIKKCDQKSVKKGYRFNCGERLGNWLLAPQNGIINTWINSSKLSSPINYLTKLCLVIVTLVFGLFTILGLIIKIISEKVNSSGHLRAQARQLQKEISCLEIKTKQVRYELQNLIQTIDSLKQAVFNGKPGAIDLSETHAWQQRFSVLSTHLNEKKLDLFLTLVSSFIKHAKNLNQNHHLGLNLLEAEQKINDHINNLRNSLTSQSLHHLINLRINYNKFNSIKEKI